MRLISSRCFLPLAAYPYPGRSTMFQSPSFMQKWFISNVLPGVCEVFASPLLRVSVFIRDDLPTLLRPMKAYSGTSVSGHLLTSALLIRYLEFFISVLFSQLFSKNVSCIIRNALSASVSATTYRGSWQKPRGMTRLRLFRPFAAS